MFFAIVDTFIAAFAEAKQDNKNMAKRKEEEEKRALIEAQVRTGLDKKEGKRTCQSRILQSYCLPLQLKKEREQRAKKAAEEDRSEFDDLVSALRSGEVFDKDMSKMNRRKQRRHDFDGSRERPVSKLEQ